LIRRTCGENFLKEVFPTPLSRTLMKKIGAFALATSSNAVREKEYAIPNNSSRKLMGPIPLRSTILELF
jgi:hypothetical protein